MESDSRDVDNKLESIWENCGLMVGVVDGNVTKGGSSSSSRVSEGGRVSSIKYICCSSQFLVLCLKWIDKERSGFSFTFLVGGISNCCKKDFLTYSSIVTFFLHGFDYDSIFLFSFFSYVFPNRRGQK